MRSAGGEGGCAVQQRVEALVVGGQLDERGAVARHGDDEGPDVLVLDVMLALDLVGDAAQVAAQLGHPGRVGPVDELGGRDGEPVDVDGHRAVHDAVVGALTKRVRSRANPIGY